MVGGMIGVADGQGADGGLDGAGGAEEVAGHRLGGTDDEAVFCVVAEDGLDGLGLADVADAGRGAVGVDVIDFAGIDARLVPWPFACSGPRLRPRGGGRSCGRRRR